MTLKPGTCSIWNGSTVSVPSALKNETNSIGQLQSHISETKILKQTKKYKMYMEIECM